jgi:hypothetical protein
VAGSLVLGAVIFTIAVVTGALLSGALLSDALLSDAEADSPGTTADPSPGATADPPPDAAVDPHDPRYAYSLIITGAGALAVSVAGIALVSRRRQHW